jgi:hypothetical protein
LAIVLSFQRPDIATYRCVYRWFFASFMVRSNSAKASLDVLNFDSLDGEHQNSFGHVGLKSPAECWHPLSAFATRTPRDSADWATMPAS